MAEVTQDGYLGGRLRIWQEARGYRAGVDPVLLAAFVEARAGQEVLELGCGVGTAALCLATRVGGLRLAGLERQETQAELARRNARENGIAFEVFAGDVAEMPPELRQRQFDHVLMNPPYFDRASSRAGPHPAREAAMGEDTPLSDWIEAAARRLRYRGSLSVIYRAERLPELLTCIARHLGSIELLPLLPRAGRDASLVLLRARKGGRAAFRLRAGLVMHAGARHASDGDDYTEALRAVLRDGAALPVAQH